MSKAHPTNHGGAASPIDAEHGTDPGAEPAAWIVATRERVSDALGRVSGFVERQPLLAVGAATTVGFLLARLVRR